MLSLFVLYKSTFENQLSDLKLIEYIQKSLKNYSLNISIKIS